MSDQFPAITVLAPLLAGVLGSLLGIWRKHFCLPLTLGGIGLALLAAVGMLANVLETGTETYFMGGWPSPMGIELSADPLSALVVVVILVVALLVAVSSIHTAAEETPDKIPQFHTLFLLLVSGLVGITLTADAFNLFVLLEVSSLTSYALIAMGRSKRAPLAAFNYVIMGTIGASLYLLGVGFLYMRTGTLNMGDIQRIIVEESLRDSPSIQVAFILIMVGVWLKMAFFPLHGWLPNAYTFSPSASSSILAPLMTKVSVYIMVRVILGVFGSSYVFGHLHWGTIVTWLAVIAIVAGSVLALAQKNLKKMLCYLIVAEVGYMVGGAWLGNETGMLGTSYHILSDAFMTPLPLPRSQHLPTAIRRRLDRLAQWHVPENAAHGSGIRGRRAGDDRGAPHLRVLFEVVSGAGRARNRALPVCGRPPLLKPGQRDPVFPDFRARILSRASHRGDGWRGVRRIGIRTRPRCP